MDNTVLIALIAFVCTSFVIIALAIFKICYASKCRSYGICWGCITADDRDTEHEQPVNSLEITAPRLPNLNNNFDL